MASQDKIIDEHFWFTATTIGFNFVIIDKVLGKINFNYILPYILIINLYAVFLILHRSAAHAQRLTPPSSKLEKDKTYSDKLKETKNNFWSAFKMISVVIIEFSDSLFYILLIVGSFLGIILQNHSSAIK